MLSLVIIPEQVQSTITSSVSMMAGLTQSSYLLVCVCGQPKWNRETEHGQVCLQHNKNTARTNAGGCRSCKFVRVLSASSTTWRPEPSTFVNRIKNLAGLSWSGIERGPAVKWWQRSKGTDACDTISGTGDLAAWSHLVTDRAANGKAHCRLTQLLKSFWFEYPQM
jgi:hypothetical protein